MPTFLRLSLLATLVWFSVSVVMITVTPLLARAAGTVSPRISRLGMDGVPGWNVGGIRASRHESNWRAWRDSHVGDRYFYHRSWSPLGRMTGWFESFTLTQGDAEADTVVLVSEFATVAEARGAY